MPHRLISILVIAMSGAEPIRQRKKSDTSEHTIIHQSQEARNNSISTIMQPDIVDSESLLAPVPSSGEDPTSSLDDQDNNYWENRLRQLQTKAIIASHVLALIAMTVVIVWINLLGGLSSWGPGKAKLVFNWHPLLMITAFSFMTVATFSFRWQQYYIPNRRLAKLLHGSAWAVAALCMLVGLLAVFQSHNDKQSGFVANMYSLHSWIGVFTILMYVFQFLAGLFTFGGVPLPFFLGGTTVITQSFKAKMLTVHYYVGPLVYLSTATTILLGIQEKEGFVGCAYKVTQADLFPIQHFSEIPFACRVSHLLGIVVLLMAASTTFAMHDFGRGSFHRQ
jgi:cytochrome b-561